MASEPPTRPSSGSTSSLISTLERARQVASRPLVSRTLTLVALGALIWGSVVAFNDLPPGQEIDWRALSLAAIVATPLGVALNAAEYRLSAMAVSVTPTWSSSMRVSVYGTAANLLPVPGSSLIRIDAISRAGAGYRRATLTTVGVGLIWLGVSIALAGLIGVATEPWLSLAFIVGGALPLVAAARVYDRIGASPRFVLRIAAVQVGSVTVQALRLYVAIEVVGGDATLPRAFALGISVAVAAAAGFLPGGLGIREAVAVMLGPMVGLTATETFLATVLDRAASFAAVALMAVIVLVATRGHAERLVASEPDETFDEADDASQDRARRGDGTVGE
jgi:hypothetical protein